ncbi:conserved hypothetical protein [uncultured spirochete]|uniref:ABC transporter domain-containing protein n=1 Tax=uncultured spirochete TaxID=156406 RepID=A0A3P3XRR7_9SPIR|nr:conserved hypothetical protein [uncultured spirochete]
MVLDSPVLEAVGICKAFNKVSVLSNVDLRLYPGQVHAIVGQNGAGKSTLMKILNGVYRKDSGEIKINGQSCSYNSHAEAARQGISMVFQDFSLVPSMKVYQNIFLSQVMSRKGGGFFDERTMKEKARELLKEVGVDINIDVEDLVENVSVGSRQLVEIAKALCLESKILIFDEPTASLSTAEITRLFFTVSRLKSRNVAIVYITHYLQDVFKICDSITVLRDGKVSLDDAIANVDMGKVIHAMTGKVISVEKSARAAKDSSQPEVLRLESVSTKKIQNMSFTLRKGEILGLAGLLGSGRTELLRALYGLDKIISGEIFVDGKRVNIHATRDAKKSRIALVPEDRRTQGLIMDFSLYDNIVVGVLPMLTRHGFVQKSKGESVARSYISDFKIKANGISDGVRFLSGGNQQKVVIAKNIADQPEILLLDDPTFGIDIQSKTEIMEIIRKYVEQGNAAILVSSEFNELIELCDRILIIKKGTISQELEVSAQSAEEALLQLAQ